MYYDIVDFKYIKDYKLEIKFQNGKKGIVDLKSYKNKGGVFSAFEDISFFKKVFLNKELNVLCWPNNIDIAPETLYQMATGEYLFVDKIKK